jgi:uncharacterized protein
MGSTRDLLVWQPVTPAERYRALDALRGLALLGVLLVNLHSDFQVSLAEHILTFHTDPGWANRAADVAVVALLEFKAFALFSLLFGVGMAVFADRAAARGAGAVRFLARRLLILLALGLCHLLLVWNGDILTLYAVCGFLLLPLLRLPTIALAVLGAVAVVLPFVISWDFAWPGDDTLRQLATEANRVYTEGRFGDILAFHWWETQRLTLPLLVAALPRTWGLMALGAAAWRAGVFRNPTGYARWLWAVALVGGVGGGTATALWVYATSTGQPAGDWSVFLDAGSVPLALAYAAGLLLVLRSARAARLAEPLAAIGQMALTNYLMQSVVLSLLFYGYGLGLYGRLGSAAGVGIGLLLYAAQVALSRAWLRRYRFGPVEWLWRSLTYGSRQPLRLAEGTGLSERPSGVQ